MTLSFTQKVRMNFIKLANLTEQFSNDIKMEFGIDKCKINSIRAWQNYQHHFRNRRTDTIIR